MALVQVRQDRVAQRLGGRDDERAAEPGELGQPVAVAQEVLDLRRDVEGETRELVVERPRDGQGMAGPVQEVGIAERNVSGARIHLLPDVGEQHRGGDDEKAPAIDGRNGTVPAHVLAAPTRLDVAHGLETAVTLQVCVFLQRGQLGPTRHRKAELLQHRTGEARGSRPAVALRVLRAPQPPSQVDERRFDLTAHDRIRDTG